MALLFEHLALDDLGRMIIDDLMRRAPDRNDAALMTALALMFAALNDGSLCVNLDTAVADVRVNDEMASLLAAQMRLFGIRLERGDYRRLVHDDTLRRGEDPGDEIDMHGFKPLVMDVAGGRRLLYFQKFYFHERRLKSRLAAFWSQTAQRPLPPAEIARIVDGLYASSSVIRKGTALTAIARDPYQEAAIRAALVAPLIVVSGGPGTGKTSLLVNMLRALVRTGTDPSRILLAAPTGRAAQRMTEALTASLATIKTPDAGDRALSQLSGATLHKTLVYRRRRNGFLHGAQRPLPADVVAVDEVSMVDVVMMDHLFQAVDPDRTRLILLGDKDQLPSVDAGSVLADMPHTVGSGVDAFVELKNVYRSSGALTDLARTINAGRPLSLEPVDFETALKMGQHRWAFVHADDSTRFPQYVDLWIDHQYRRLRPDGHSGFVGLVQHLKVLYDDDRNGSTGENERQHLLDAVFERVWRCRILTALRRGPHGARDINAYIAGRFRRELDPDAAPQDRLFAGAVIMITRNDYQRSLFNGDIGVVLPDTRSTCQVYFRRGHRLVAFPTSGLPEWEYGWAMTVHKSQGSEFDDAWLILPEDPEHRLLTREIVYTAATRAARRLILYGTPTAFHNALKRKILRQSGMVPR